MDDPFGEERAELDRENWAAVERRNEEAEQDKADQDGE